jgi:MFS transporter, Spinster family, sphingosine-1-phosphate transporter
MPTYILEQKTWDAHEALERLKDPLAVKEKLDQINTIFGAIVVVAGLSATLLGGFLGDKLRARFPGSYFLVSGIAMMLGVPFILLVLICPFPLGWIFVFLACFCLFFNTGPTNTILANVIHPSVRASGFALNILIIHLFGDAVSPMILGWVNGYYDNMNVGFMAISAMFLVAGVLWLWGTRYLENDTALAPTRLG